MPLWNSSVSGCYHQGKALLLFSWCVSKGGWISKWNLDKGNDNKIYASRFFLIEVRL